LSTIDFASRAFLTQHVDRTLAFYAPVARDPEGGFFHYFLDDGTVYERSHRHLVSATRFVFNWAMAYRHTGQAVYLEWTGHALAHLQAFRLPSGLYGWTVDQGKVQDATAMAYGQAFVLLAYSHAARVGACTRDAVAQAFDRMEAAFFEPQYGAYADEITPAGVLLDYRGQNANMHMCEACLAAFESTGEQRYWDRAVLLIERFAFGLAAQSHGLVWEHYRRYWSLDWDYNRDNPGNIFKPWGFQTGHQTEWAKLLLIAYQHQPDPRWLQCAQALHEAAYRYGWDAQHGGLVYGFDPDLRHSDTDKYFWVQAESFASAWRLWRVTGQQQYLDHYQQTWDWSWRHMVDHQYGAWFRILAADGSKLENTKSPAGKVDYHTMGACWDVMQVGGLRE